MNRRPLTFAGGDVAPILRRADGRAVVVYLDRFGRPSSHTAEAWPHELRGVGWHLAEIRRLVELLPAEPGAADASPVPLPSRPSRDDGAAGACPKQPSRTGGFLSAHFAVPEGDR